MKWILGSTSHHREGQKTSKYQKDSCQSDLQVKVANFVICLTSRLGMKKVLLRELSKTSNMNLRLGLQISTCLSVVVQSGSWQPEPHSRLLAPPPTVGWGKWKNSKTHGLR